MRRSVHPHASDSFSQLFKIPDSSDSDTRPQRGLGKVGPSLDFTSTQSLPTESPESGRSGILPSRLTECGPCLRLIFETFSKYLIPVIPVILTQDPGEICATARLLGRGSSPNSTAERSAGLFYFHRAGHLPRHGYSLDIRLKYSPSPRSEV